MTIERFAQRLAAGLAVGGLLLLLAAFLCAVSGDGVGVVNSVHNVGGFILASLGVFFVLVGLTVASAVPGGSERTSSPGEV
ncbi:MAG: hypothetical protein KDB43_14860 [Nocardioidaceae bacterium]|nr:hypothetical protein [Nocardioidaceae bacterium]